MPTVTVFTADRMRQIEDNTITNAEVIDGDLILQRYDGSIVNAGPVTAAPSPIVKTHYGSDVTLAAAAADTWYDWPGGTPSAGPMDMVVPGVEVGDWVSVDFHALVVAANPGVGVYFDIWFVVAGVPVRRFGPGTSGTSKQSSWYVTSNSSTNNLINGRRSSQIQAGDIEDGNVRLRMRYNRGAGSVMRTVLGTFDIECRMEANGPFG